MAERQNRNGNLSRSVRERVMHTLITFVVNINGFISAATPKGNKEGHSSWVGVAIPLLEPKWLLTRRGSGRRTMMHATGEEVCRGRVSRERL
jgi:hypothetical protein